MIINKHYIMYKNKVSLLILMLFCISISLGAVSANENVTNIDNLTAIDNPDSNNNLNAIEEIEKEDTLGQIDESNYNSSNNENATSNDVLGVSENDSSETLTLSVNPSEDLLTSSVDVYSAHTYHKKGYTFTVSANQYKKIQYVKHNKYDSPDDMNGHEAWFKVKTNKFYKYKKYIYKKVKVTKYKWKYKYVLTGKSYYKNGRYHYKNYNKVRTYYNKGWKYHAYASESNSQGGYNDYAVVKKKVKYTATKKVKTNKYKTAKKRIYATIETHRTGDYPNMYYMVTYDFYVFGFGYIKCGGAL